ncbi:hypothetical protein [Curtobacterium flaccumfaciens]|uniref:hypothetical protein n=1 Tax=Curtobacterium flaccumfaciens TaxID=2035 RepID=UPI003D9AB4E7
MSIPIGRIIIRMPVSASIAVFEHIAAQVAISPPNRMSAAEHIVAAIDAAFIAIIVSCIMSISMSISMGMSVIDMFFIIAIVSIAGLLVLVIGHEAVRPACPPGYARAVRAS